MIGGTLSTYRIDAELGQGGMGTVYKAEVSEQVPGLQTGTSVALKVIHSNLLAQPGFFQRFLREAQVGQRVEHANVVRTYACDATLHEGVQKNFLVMEYVEGQTLRDLMKELGRVPEELCRHIAREVAQGLTAIHAAGIVHRDIKPENVLITEEQVVKVMDLGVARLQDEAIKLSQTGAFLGSVEYAAPEQFMGSGENIDGRTDLHALGLILYELATGQNPYRDEDARKVLRKVLDEEPRRAGEINPQISPFFEEVVHTLLAKDREERFASAEALSQILDAGEDGDWWKERAKALRIETKQPLRRVRVPRETALYGRDAEIEKLHALFAKAKDGHGQVLLVEGEAGIGKTRLVDELVGRLRQEGEEINFLFGAYPPGGAATAAGAFSTAYREQFGKEGLQETLQEYLTDTPLLIPAFAALLKGDATPTGAEPLTKDSLQTVFVHATRALAAERTTIVLIDDLHFAPEDGRSLFAALAMALPEHRVLLVGTARRGIGEDWIADLDRLGHFSRIGLDRLGPKELGQLVLDVFRSQRLADELGFQIVMKSDGNPYFVFELIRGLREGKLIAQTEDGSWVSTQVIKDITIPSSVMDLIEARLADVSDEDRELLDVAACCGAEFDAGLVADTLGLKRIPALRALGRIEKQHHLVRATGPVFAFDHYQVQESLYKGLSEPLRKEYHGALAESLEEREGAADAEPADIDGDVLVQLCEHFLQGNQPKRALRYLESALEYLEKGYLNDQAIQLAERALVVPRLLDGTERVEVLLRKNGPLARLGHPDSQEELLAEAVALAAKTQDTALHSRVRNALGDLLNGIARFKAARVEYEAALELATAAGDRQEEARAALGLGHVSLSQGRYKEAIGHFERSLATYAEIGDRKGEGVARGGLGTSFVWVGRFDEALVQQRQHVEIAEEFDDRRGQGTAAGGLGMVFQATGRFAEAKEQRERQIEIAREIGDRRSEAAGLGNLANTFGYEGRTAGALERYERHLAISREIGYHQSEGVGWHNLGGLLARLGAYETAKTKLEAALERGRTTGHRILEGATLTLLARRTEEWGDLDGTSRYFQEALAVFEDLGSVDQHAADAHLYYGTFLRRSGQVNEARTQLRRALAIGEESGVAQARALALVHLALTDGGDAVLAADALAESEEHMDIDSKMEARFLLWQATGDKQHLEAAHDLLTFFVEHAPEEYRETTLTNVPLHRDIMQAWNAQEANA